MTPLTGYRDGFDARSLMLESTCILFQAGRRMVEHDPARRLTC